MIIDLDNRLVDILADEHFRALNPHWVCNEVHRIVATEMGKMGAWEGDANILSQVIQVYSND